MLGTGWFGAVAAEAGPGKTVAVVGDGAVGLLAVLAAKQLPRRRAVRRWPVLQPSHLHGGPAPVRCFLPQLVDIIWNRQIDPGKVFDLELPFEQTAAGSQAMDQRRGDQGPLRPR